MTDELNEIVHTVHNLCAKFVVIENPAKIGSNWLLVSIWTVSRSELTVVTSPMAGDDDKNLCPVFVFRISAGDL